ncbi:MAG TPA: Uma2 family endonuclease [Urbifossiella sp.]|nr:Uma2 family endonuclease [Urbifossiella sp.]
MSSVLTQDEGVSLRDLLDPRPRVTGLPKLYEVIHGEIRERPTVSTRARHISNRLNRAVITYLNDNPHGECEVEQAFHIPQPEDAGRTRIPDWSYVSFARWPADRAGSATANAWDVVPDIAAEVVSPSDPADDLIAKVREYLRGSVRLVWVFYPQVGEVQAYWAGANTIRVYAATDELDAGDILPGFRTPVAPLFPPVTPA